MRTFSTSLHTPAGRRLAVLAATAGLTVTLAGCGGNDSSTGASGGGSTAPSSAAATVDGIATAHNDADVMFINDMTPHHSGAVMMAEMAVERATDPQVKALAGAIMQAQGPEQQRMAQMAQAWGVPVPKADAESGGGHGGHGGGSQMDAMMAQDMAADMAALEAASGPAFDREFLTRMIAHHEGALPMARTELADGSNPQANQLAQEIIDSQTAEISRMRELLTAL